MTKYLTPIPGYSKYVITIDGDVVRVSSGRLLKRCYDTRGYAGYNLAKDGGGNKTMTVHRLLALTFIPNDHDRPQVNHRDGDRANNNLSNLEWVTPSENVKHAFDLGLYPDRKGESHGGSKLTEADVLMIRAETGRGANARMARQFKVTPSMISRIRTRKAWTHI